MLLNSFVSANAFPHKILRDIPLLTSIIEKKKILPRHVQLSPTNKCNLNCSFCSCKLRDLSQEWSYDDLLQIVNILKKLEVISVTITGGGEPLLYKYINNLICALADNNIKIGLVTNGCFKLSKEIINKITWCRVSFSDERSFNNKFLDNIHSMSNSNIDMAFSYVLTSKPNFTNVVNIIDLANELNFTHIRLVSNILDPSSAENLDYIKQQLQILDIDDSLVIYQPRNEYNKGSKRCLISLLKPFIYSDGNIYPCCGVQYALSDEKCTLPQKMIMGNYTNLEDIINNQKHFNGSICDICYYQNYNDLLNILMTNLKHVEFL
ncbi:MAG: radical SAM protein [Candidatus Caldatribacteriota bacterium]|nr:radical SAM protein [Patescibacteria group bacterium]